MSNVNEEILLVGNDYPDVADIQGLIRDSLGDDSQHWMYDVGGGRFEHLGNNGDVEKKEITPADLTAIENAEKKRAMRRAKRLKYAAC
jgi:hypothetical protein